MENGKRKNMWLFFVIAVVLILALAVYIYFNTKSISQVPETEEDLLLWQPNEETEPLVIETEIVGGASTKQHVGETINETDQPQTEALTEMETYLLYDPRGTVDGEYVMEITEANDEPLENFTATYDTVITAQEEVGVAVSDFKITELPDEVITVLAAVENASSVIYDGICSIGYGDFNEATYVNHKINPYSTPGSENLMYIALRINDVTGAGNSQRYVDVMVTTDTNTIQGVVIDGSRGELLPITR